MAQLEKDLAVQLFYRQHRKLALTPEGNRLYLRAKEMFEAGQRLLNVVSPIPLGNYPISIGLVPSPSIHVAYQIVGSYLRSHKHLNMKLIHSDYEDLEDGLTGAKFDFGFSDRAPKRRDLIFHRISRAPIKFFVSNKWTDTSFAELLSQLPILICNAQPAQRSFAEQALIEADLVPSSVVTSDYPSALLDLCEDGLGIGVFSEAEGLKSLRVPKDAPKLQDNLYIIWSEEVENSAAVRRLKEIALLEKPFGTA